MRSMKDSLDLGSPVYTRSHVPVAFATLDKWSGILEWCKEHQRYLGLGQKEKSVLACHGLATRHTICFEKHRNIVSILFMGNEGSAGSLEIQLTKEVLNCEEGVRLSATWLSMLESLR